MGTRLREQTESRPKPMLEVGGVPILVHIMRMYAAAGMTEFVLCLGYKAAVIKDYFLNYEAMTRDFTVDLGRPGAIEFHGASAQAASWKVTLADTGESTLTGGRVARALRYVPEGETFAVTYGDGVSDVDLRAVLAFHRKSGRAATVTGVRPPSRFGEIEHDGDRVTTFNEKPQAGQGLINGGFLFFEPRFRQYLDVGPQCALEHEPLERSARDGELAVYQHGGFWQCVDTNRDWERLESLWQTGAPPWVRS
jgi:glucose-1-phosphate cytidylyltransferase